ncbi:hypothetical protein BOX15_Mlig019135g1, partial [Macrostomum lignano]
FNIMAIRYNEPSTLIKMDYNIGINGCKPASALNGPPFQQCILDSKDVSRAACRSDGTGRQRQPSAPSTAAEEAADSDSSGSRVRVLTPSCQLCELHTLLRDRDTSRSDFVFYADRLIRLLVEEALNYLPYQSLSVLTPGGHPYDGLRASRGSCGISVMPSGEAMEKGLRDCCRAIRIGKMLIQGGDCAGGDCADAPEPVYVRLPPRVHQRRVLLMQPVLGDGRVATKALQLLTEDYQVPESNLFLLNLFSTRHGLDSVLSEYPDVRVLTTEVHDLVPYHFCARYFGID